jgi:hypothetical protein
LFSIQPALGKRNRVCCQWQPLTVRFNIPDD